MKTHQFKVFKINVTVSQSRGRFSLLSSRKQTVLHRENSLIPLLLMYRKLRFTEVRSETPPGNSGVYLRCTSLAQWPSPSRSDRPRSPQEPAYPGSRAPPEPGERHSSEFVFACLEGNS